MSSRLNGTLVLFYLNLFRVIPVKVVMVILVKLNF